MKDWAPPPLWMRTSQPLCREADRPPPPGETGGVSQLGAETLRLTQSGPLANPFVPTGTIPKPMAGIGGSWQKSECSDFQVPVESLRDARIDAECRRGLHPERE